MQRSRCQRIPHWIGLLGAVLCLIGSAAASRADTPVTVTTEDNFYILDNGLLTAKIARRSGGLTSLKYKGTETLGGVSGHPGGYWSHEPGSNSRIVEGITIDPKANNGERAEVSVKGFYQGTPLGSGPGGSAVADIEIRYALGRGDSALYTYSIFDHKPNYPNTSIGEARYAAKLNDKIFDYMAVDDRRKKEMLTSYDWSHGTQLNMKEARRLNSGQYKGQVEHKYDYSAVQFDSPTFGWSSSKAHIGFWIVNPTIEYLSGGPTKIELTTHRDAVFSLDPNAIAVPVVLNYWRGSHYGGSVCDVAQGESWTRVIGPFLIYCNSGPSNEAMWKDAQARAASEANAWPYSWVNGVDYPHKDQRGTVSGQIILNDPQAPRAKMTNLLVGLAHPDYTPPGGRTLVDWQLDARYYQFWVKGDAQGRFTIPNVRPGTYTLHAIADGVLGEYAQTDITVAPGKPIDLGKLTWKPVRYGRQIWEIGIPDRTAGEFLHGDHYYQWGLYNQYPKDFPNDVNFVIGKSDYHKDWNYAQVPRATDDTGRSSGPSTNWSVTFDLPNAPHGKATLRLSLAGTSARSIAVSVNDQPAGDTGPLTDTATIRRDTIRGYWKERDIAFDASLLKAGKNILKLTIPPGNVMSGIEYDYLRLELADTAPVALGNR